ncbi:aldo/keto reductase [Mumia sp. ZJ430]|uniref:aldo/keto reductase n=1 Tax=Mumia sp. ZJ430 TaxID=2708083 RepID=UPI0014246CE3|nr:aldo/keto reductase [Mumia sp. ZJ430]
MESRDTFLFGGDFPVARIGFGAMQLPTAPTDARTTSVAVLRRAVALGVTLIDTAHLYGWGANEELVAEALRPYPDDVLVATKVGVVRDPVSGDWGYDARPESLRSQVDEALRRLGTERLGLLQLHRLDPQTPLVDQVGTLGDLRREGKIARIGLSEVTADELDAARQVVEIASVQNHYNVFDRAYEPVLAACEGAGIAFLPWRPVAGAMADTPASAVVVEIATELGASPAQVALAWLLAHSPVIVPIPGTKQISHLEGNVRAGDLVLTNAHVSRLDALNDTRSPAPS